MIRTNGKYRLLLSGATGAMALSAWGTPAAAQDGALDQAVEQENQIVVTGSRIVRRDYEANSPIVTVDQAAIENRSELGVEDALNELPQFSPAGSSALASDAGAAFAGPNAAPGAATVDLRGLGTNRTLVLVNGRRAQPVNAALLVDLNTIPSAAIENVEVITGGAASVYGADAIAGVVNFILRDDFEGVELDAQAGISEAGDGETFDVSALIGGNFADGKGNAMLGVTWSQRKAAFQNNRDFYTDSWLDPTNSVGAGARPITTAVVGGQRYGVNFDGSLFLIDNATFDPDGAGPIGIYNGPQNDLDGGAGFRLNAPNASGQRSLGYVEPDNVINIPLERWTIFGSAHYDLTDSIELFAEGRYSHSLANAQSIPGTLDNMWQIAVPYDPANDDPDSPTFGANVNTFHPVSRQLADLLNARPAPAAPWSMYRGLQFGGRLYIETTTDVFQITTGLRGDVGFKDWTWEVYGSHGDTNVVAQQPQGPISHSNLQQIVNGVTTGTNRSLTINGPWSQGWSSGALFNPQTCTSGIPFFNANGSVPQPTGNTGEGVVISDDCRNYITLELNNVTQLNQNIVEATMQGGLFEWWPGEVRFSLGATYRDASFRFYPDAGNSAEQPTTNVVNQIVMPAQTEGSTAVKEVFGELLVPLLTDLPLIRQLDLELGARYSDYNNAGQVWTYKILGDWEVTDFLRIRGGYQRANRAPNIYEQFAPVAGTIGASLDPCVNIAGFTPAYGNRMDNPNIINTQLACEALILRDGGFDYVTLAEDPSAVAQDPTLFPNLDQTRLSNHRTILGYNGAFPFSVGLTQGNPNLESELAETITIGGVLRSPFDAPGLNRITLSVDYYKIKLDGTIGQPNGTEIYSQCFDPQFNPLMGSAAGSLSGEALLAGNEYCDLINRYPFDPQGVRGAPGSGTDRTYQAQFINKGGTKTSGIDVAFNWGADFQDLGLGIPGGLNINASANILLDFQESPFPGAEFRDYRGTLTNDAYYDYKLFGSVNYVWDRGSIGLRGRYLPSIEPSVNAQPGTLGTDSHTEFSLFGRYELTEAFELRAGVDNLFNARPEIVGATPLSSNSGTTNQIYDTMGRSYYLGLRLRM
jgi:outer membrane receptor protein involved in Fe transport